ncbi:SDR family NAD(P)-dependent oxidoreductase [candidate division KSB1 bacterium]|nr:SDR family NAD(P)-dependent oxidoreductase [candidate division KSB1 bacterium]
MVDTKHPNQLLTEKNIIVTGPTSGIGEEIAAQLADFGAHVILASRDLEKGERTLAEIAQRTGNQNCKVMQIDTSSQQSIQEFASRYQEAHARLDVLVNNAGIFRTTRHLSVDGIELTFATNVLGYHLLTRELLDLLRKSAPVRIVNVASTFAFDLDLEDLQFERRAYEGRKAYAQSKACNRMLTRAWARRLEDSGVTVNSMAPGLVMTGLYRDTSPMLRLFLRIIRLFHGRSASQGADTAVWLASNPEVEGITGKFYEMRQQKPCEFSNFEAEEKLWTICEELTARRMVDDHNVPR